MENKFQCGKTLHSKINKSEESVRGLDYIVAGEGRYHGAILIRFYKFNV